MEVLVGDHFGLDESPLKVAVDSSSSLRCQAAPWDRPASDLFLASYMHKSAGWSPPKGLAKYEHTGEVVLQAELCESLSDDLLQLGANFALLEERGLRVWVILHAVDLLFELDGEGDDVSGNATVLGDPLGNGRQVLALLPQIVLHRQVDEVDDGLGGDELDLLVDERDLGRRPGSIPDRLILFQHLSHEREHTKTG